MKYDDIIKIATNKTRININPQDVATPLFVGPNATFTGRYKVYSEAGDELEADLTNGVDDPEYLAATIAFQQSPRPSKVMIGKKEAGDADYTVALNAIFAATQDFMGLSIDSRVIADQQAASAWAQANERLCAHASSDANIIDQDVGTDTTSIAALTKNAQQFNTSVIYHSKANDEYIDFGYLTYGLQQPYGSYTLAGKAITGITQIDNQLTTTQYKNLFDKNVSCYTDVGGSPEINFGTVADGDFFDVVHFMYVSKIKLQEAMLGERKKRGKIKYNGSGFSSLQDACTPTFNQMVLNQAIEENNYDDDGNQIDGWQMIFPTREQIDPIDKGNRLLKNVVTNLWYTGAVHKVEMELNIII